MNLIKKDFIFEEVSKLKGVGEQLSKYLKKKELKKLKIFYLIYLIQKQIDRNYLN